MLLERIIASIPDVKMLQINTDGLTSVIPKTHVNTYYEICKDWEEVTRLVLEHVDYDKMIIRDVNNYIGVYPDGKVKYKGAFKPNSEMRKDGEYHKSFSQGIVATAVAKYFIEGVPVEKTVTECTDIYEFCKTGNTTGKWWAETFEVDESGEEFNVVSQQKNNRYYLSESGVGFRKRVWKVNSDTGEEELASTEYEADKKVVIFNTFEQKSSFSDYEVDYQYYIDEAFKIIHRIDGTEERLENERREQREQEKRDREEANFIKFCVDKVPTKRQYEMYSKPWLIEKYGERETR